MTSENQKLTPTPFLIFKDILKRNNDYSNIFDFKRGWGGMGVITFFILEVPIIQIPNVNKLTLFLYNNNYNFYIFTYV